jgi:peptide/nickel transport system ATP-binding protein
MTVGEALREGLARNAKSGTGQREVARLLGYVELPASYEQRYPHQLSGGQRQRVALARALAVEPAILILDEITSALDVSVQASMLNLLRRLQDEIGFSCLLISHDLAVVSYMSDRILVMYLGQVIESSPAGALVATPSHPYTVALLDAVPSLDRNPSADRSPIFGEVPDPKDPPSGCRFHPRCPIGPVRHADRGICAVTAPELRSVGVGHACSCHFAEAEFS